MKRIWVLIVFTVTSLFVSAQITEFPQYEFKSTSSHQYINVQHQYTIPLAVYDDMQTPTTIQPRKVIINGDGPGYNPADPYWENVALGDDIIPLLVISFTYCLYIRLSKNHIL